MVEDKIEAFEKRVIEMLVEEITGLRGKYD